MEELFAAIRAAADAGAWSRGVELAREGAVHGERDDGDEVVLRVAVPGRPVAPTVVLHPGDEEWDCDCADREEVCEHAAAAAIALRRARRAGEALPGSGADTGRIGVRLERRGGELHFERVVVSGASETPLRGTIAAVQSGRVEGPACLATTADVRVESALGPRLRGALPRGLWAPLLTALSAHPDVRLDGEPVRASAERVGFAARLEDAPEGFRLRVSRDPRVVEVFDAEVALLADGTLCLVGASQLSGREREELTRGRIYRADETAVLVTEVLPSLRKRIPVEIVTDRLPGTRSEPPRIDLQVEREGDALGVLPRLVYGDPPTARVDAERLVPLGGPLPLRDEAAERRLLRRLQSELELAPGRRLVTRGEEALALAEKLRRWDAGLAPALGSFHRAGTLAPRFESGAGGFDLHFELEAEEGKPRRASSDAVLRAWRAGDSLLPLGGGGFAALPEAWLGQHGDRVADLLAARGAKGELPAAALPELAELAEALDAPVPEAAATLREALRRDAPVDDALPDGLRAELRPYQREGVHWLARRRGLGLPALLADDMGLGKTLQALCAVRGRTLVVAPTSVVPNWAAEIERFRPDLRVCLYQGPGRALDPEADLSVTSWTLLRLDSEALAAVDWDSVVLDESQAIKNPDSQVARAAFALPGRFRLALTGTPVENRLSELWSQFHFLSRGWLGARRDFEERFAKPIAAGDAAATERLRRRVAPFVLRRMKREVAPELPPRTEQVLHVELSEPERAVYDAIRAATRDEVAKRFGGGGGTFQVLEALLRLRQAACSADLVPGAGEVASSKLAVLHENLEEVVSEGHKALVFSQWTQLLDRVEPGLRAAGLGFARLDGSTRDRAGSVARFQADDGPPLMLVSLGAGGSGLNLTAADTVFILDPWWNPAVEDQAADRAHRIGQTRPVMVYRLVARDTVEERVLALQERKRELADAALGAPGGPPLSREDLFELLD